MGIWHLLSFIPYAGQRLVTDAGRERLLQGRCQRDTPIQRQPISAGPYFDTIVVYRFFTTPVWRTWRYILEDEVDDNDSSNTSDRKT